MRRATFREHLRYRFDNSMARGPGAMIGWLFLVSVLLIVLVSLFVQVTGQVPSGEDHKPIGFGGLLWWNLMRALDSGAIGGDSGTPLFLATMFAMTLGGIFVVSMLIGVVTSGIEARLEELRKGRSFVAEEGHTLILGWSSHVFTILSELVVANANQRRACIVILADKDKVEMDDELRARLGPTGRTRIVCRTGSPIDLADLEIANPHAARSIIVLAPEDENADSSVIKSVLAITNNPGRRAEPYHIVAELRDARNLEAARLVGREETSLILVDDLISRIMVQTCRQSGLSVVYTELLDFGGDEIYFAELPGLVGRTFGEALSAFADSSLIGLRRHDGQILVHPPMDLAIAAGDRVIAISADDDTVRAVPVQPDIDEAAIRLPVTRIPQPERILVLGWNERAPTVITELDRYVAPGSSMTVVSDIPEAAQVLDELRHGLERQSVELYVGDTTDRRVLEAMRPGGYDHIITLSSDGTDVQEADGRTLVTLLHLRDMASRSGQDFSIVSEMLDVRNRELAQVTQADDFIVSDRLVSLLISQVSENGGLKAVFDDLFRAEGSEIYLKPASDYVALDQPLNFYTVLEAARRNEIAIGYRLRSEAESPKLAYGVHLNPPSRV
ncbi:CASTOR/POLLUX-related putative ion channel [Deinococcus hopiensis]|uniref:Trk K+ transport system, NAD-binding component n=1 Tax=Deinococcus hopiensis KR-140 TaxID=695939 RepID=A0A1W1UGV9_9DEIO|nr:potassium transporter TrkA [Deinococcus hopiensis]SMB80348.1 Trk K+ transport system, NAD-binding component [Deinococcus hopiensis KR-140]